MRLILLLAHAAGLDTTLVGLVIEPPCETGIAERPVLVLCCLVPDVLEAPGKGGAEWEEEKRVRQTFVL